MLQYLGQEQCKLFISSLVNNWVKDCLELRRYDFQNQFSHPQLWVGDYQLENRFFLCNERCIYNPKIRDRQSPLFNLDSVDSISGRISAQNPL
ncbi:MAG: hypothetical protein V7L21_26335 [Nostoc sp.]|uniref:hypothetical protein n=1 Tax=Nostoc sp. TaxID=1180 RepID=UPI002FF6CF34